MNVATVLACKAIYRYVPPQMIGPSLNRLHLKTGVDFAYFGLTGSGYSFLGNYWRVRTYLSVQFQMSKKEREICEFIVEFKKYFFIAVLI